MDPAIEAEFKKMKEKFTLMELAQSQLKQKQPTVYIKSERKLTSLIAKKEGCDMKTMDKVVTDKFIDGIMDSQIKREVRRFAFENPKLPFIEFRQRMLQWVDDTPSVKVNKVSTETPISEDLLELVKCQQNMLEHQQKQIDMLMSMTKQKPNYSPRYRGQNYREEPDVEIPVTNSDDSDEEDSYFKVMHCDQNEDIEEETVNTASDTEQPTVLPRRSTRATAGKHSNPNRLPKSTVSVQRTVIQNKNFQELSDAVVNLGTALATKLNEAWKQY
uniref:Uncharacterized protein n=1 Tax=Magallana gigas TaxID=29159 RepID=A0A8W8J7C5_MAGGI